MAWNDRPTAADYAWDSAETAKKLAKTTQQKLEELEERVRDLEAWREHQQELAMGDDA